jgi:hypothetical protein
MCSLAFLTSGLSSVISFYLLRSHKFYIILCQPHFSLPLQFIFLHFSWNISERLVTMAFRLHHGSEVDSASNRNE